MGRQRPEKARSAPVATSIHLVPLKWPPSSRGGAILSYAWPLSACCRHLRKPKVRELKVLGKGLFSFWICCKCKIPLSTHHGVNRNSREPCTELGGITTMPDNSFFFLSFFLNLGFTPESSGQFFFIF